MPVPHQCMRLKVREYVHRETLLQARDANKAGNAADVGLFDGRAAI
jgi:hypothetical protein